MYGRYLLALNIFQKACLNFGSNLFSHYLGKLAQYIRRGFIKVYMVEHDHQEALEWFNDPLLRKDIEQNATLARDLQYVLNNTAVYRRDSELIERARCYSTILGMDSLRLASALIQGLDGIITLEPDDFIQRPEDIDLVCIGQGCLFVEHVENLDEQEEDDIEVFVTTPSSFIIKMDNYLQEIAGGDLYISNDETNICSIVDSQPIVLLQDWRLTISNQGLESLAVSLKNQAGKEVNRQVKPNTGEVDSLFLEINKCTRELAFLPDFHVSYTVASAEGVPSPIEVEVGLSYLNKLFIGWKTGSSTLGCTLEAYLEALNKVLAYSQKRFLSTAPNSSHNQEKPNS